MFLLPTRGRPDKLQRLIDHAQPKERGLVIFDDDDAHNYHGITLPKSWERVVSPRDRVGPHLNRAFELYPSEPFYALMADDLLPSPGWDTALAALITPTSIIWPHDNMMGRCTHPLIGGDFVRTAGWLAAPGLKHFYVDNVWYQVAQALGIDGLIPDVNIDHRHFSNGRAAYDDTYRGRPKVMEDFIAYEKFMAKDFEPLIARLKCCM